MAYSCVRVCFEIGHEASFRNKRTPEGFTHDWEVFVRGADNTDISQFVDRVIFHLHDTFPKPKRVVKEAPYSVKESGYAGFLLPIEVYFKNRDEPKKVLFNYDLQLQPSGPPLSRVLREKFVFPNPPEDLRRKLIRGGGVGVTGSESGSFVASPKPTASEEIAPLKHTVPLVGKPKLGGDAAKKHKSKDYRLDEPPRGKDPFADLFGPPIHKTKVSPDPKKSSSTSSKFSDKSGEKQNMGGKSSKHIPQKEVKESSGSTKEEPKERSKDRDKSKDKSSKRSSTPPKIRPSSPKRSSSPKRPSTPPKHSVTPSSARSPPHKRPPTPKLKFEETKKNHEDSKGKSDSKSTESSKSEKKKKDKKSRDDKGAGSKEKLKDESKVPVEKTEKSEKSKEFKEKEKKVPKETPTKEPEKTKEKNVSVDKDKEKQKHKHKKKDKNKHEDSGKEKNKDRDKSSKKNSEKSHDVKERDKNCIGKETEEKKKVRSPSVSPARPSVSPAKPPTKERPAKHPLKLLLDELSDPESSDSNTSPMSEDESFEQSAKKPSKPKDTYNQTSAAKAIQSIEDVVNNVSYSSASKAPTSKPKPIVPDSTTNGTKLNGKQKEKSGSKKNKEKKESGGKSGSRDEGKEDKESKKRKRKNSAKGKDDIVTSSEPPEKMTKAEVEVIKADEPPPQLVMKSEPSPIEVEESLPEKAALDQFTAEYVLQLKELQRKIMTLEDNAELQRVVQVIAETGQYEITKKTFDFDLCALDRTTVKRLQDFFTAS